MAPAQPESAPRAATTASRASLREAFAALLEKYEGREFGSLVSEHAEQIRRAEGELPPRHARRLSNPTATPLCGAQEGAPWRAGAFYFDRLTCEACKDIVLGYEPQE